MPSAGPASTPRSRAARATGRSPTGSPSCSPSWGATTTANGCSSSVTPRPAALAAADVLAHAARPGFRCTTLLLAGTVAGFGAALVDGVLLGLPHDRALLTTYDDERPAPRLYRRLGWEKLATGALAGKDLWGLRLTS